MGGKIDVTNNKCKPSINTQTEESITLNRILHNDDDDYSKGILRQYFQIYEDYNAKQLARIVKCIPGVRLVDQDPCECLISFIC